MMDKLKKKNLKRIIAGVCTVAVVALLAAMPLIAGQNAREDGPKASILSGAAAMGNISTSLIGGGTLKEEDAVVISVPAEVKLTEFLAANGEVVTEGMEIARVDRVTVMEAITQVQETLEYLAEQIETAMDADTEEKVAALAGGIVKILYAQEGEQVQNVMLDHGALAVLSLDGLMAVDLETESDLSVGSAVSVAFSDGTTATGKVVKNLAGSMTVTMEDEDYPVGELVEITAPDGTAVGSGELYIYSPWNATAYAGTVDTIKVDEGDSLDAGDTILFLTDVGYSSAYRQLVGQRQQYEALMLGLFRMYQTETVTAPCDGVVSGIDSDSLQLLSNQGTDYRIEFLANAPNGDDETVYTNYIAMLRSIGQNGWELIIDPEELQIEDYKSLSDFELDSDELTELVAYDATPVYSGVTPVYELEEEQWVQVNAQKISEGDLLLFAANARGEFVWIVRVEKAETTPPQTTEPTEPEMPEDPSVPTEPEMPDDPSVPTEPEMPEDPSVPTEPEMPGDPSVPTEPEMPDDPSTPTEPGGSDMPAMPGGSTIPGGSYPSSGGSWSGIGGVSGYPQTEQEPAFELYGLSMVQVAAVTPQTVMTLEITVDELDITALGVGMTAQVRIDALGGEKYTATIAEIGNTGTGNGGNSKFTVTLTLDRTENMLVGMNATARIELASTGDVLTIPADALVEEGNQTLVYTGYDEEHEILVDPVIVQVGVSDGETVEILDGLTDGQTYYYAYYDTLEISYAPDFGGGGFMFGG